MRSGVSDLVESEFMGLVLENCNHPEPYCRGPADSMAYRSRRNRFKQSFDSFVVVFIGYNALISPRPNLEGPQNMYFAITMT